MGGRIGGGMMAGGMLIYALMGREQATELVGIVSALHAMAPSREEAAVTRQAAAIPPEGNSVLPETRPGSTELIRLRLEEAPQLKQAVQWAFGGAGAFPAEASPRPSPLAPASPSFLEPPEPFLEGAEICSNSPQSP